MRRFDKGSSVIHGLLRAEALPHRSPQRRRWPLAASISAVDLDDALPDFQVLTDRVVFLGVEAGVAQDERDLDVLRSLGNQRHEVRLVGSRPHSYGRGQDEGRVQFADARELHPAFAQVAAIPSLVPEVIAGALGVESRRVDPDLDVLGNQAGSLRPLYAGTEKAGKPPFFSSRFSATQRVE